MTTPALNRRAAAWCFTVNNYDDATLSSLRQLGNEPTTGYLVWGIETGAQGTAHVQGFYCSKNRISFATAKTRINDRAHLEPMRGTHKQASDYCKKDGAFEEYGVLPTPGARTDLGSIVERVRVTKRLRDAAEEFPELYIRYGRGIQNWYHVAGVVQPRNWRPNVYVYAGDPGTGKSRLAAEQCEAFSTRPPYYKPDGPWWDGYEGHECVIFDDFYGGYPYHDLLKCLDRYQHQVPVKGAFVEFVPRIIIFTSNKLVSKWYNADKCPVQALFRRLSNYLWFTHDGRFLPGTTVEETETGVRPSICY